MIAMNSKLAAMIDHTNLKPDATVGAIRQLCLEAMQYGFASVCVNPCHVSLCNSLLLGSPVRVCTVISFPLGAAAMLVKDRETRQAVADGASEIDMVINIGALKDRDLDLVESDISTVVQAASGRLVKVIIEACLLTDEEKVMACQAALKARADFVKTSTGFSTGGATIADVRLMRQTVGMQMGVKAAGGIRSLEFARQLIDAGATRLGSSASVKIVEDEMAGVAAETADTGARH
jgi:deoxyribose-phosphate aldolase